MWRIKGSPNELTNKTYDYVIIVLSFSYLENLISNNSNDFDLREKKRTRYIDLILARTLILIVAEY